MKKKTLFSLIVSFISVCLGIISSTRLGSLTDFSREDFSQGVQIYTTISWAYLGISTLCFIIVLLLVIGKSLTNRKLAHIVLFFSSVCLLSGIGICFLFPKFSPSKVVSLISIDWEGFNKVKKSKTMQLIYIGRQDCKGCQDFSNSLNDAINYLNDSKKQQERLIYSFDTYENTNYQNHEKKLDELRIESVPDLLVVGKGRVYHIKQSVFVQLRQHKEELIKFIQEKKFEDSSNYD